MNSISSKVFILICLLSLSAVSCFRKYDELVPLLPSVPAGGVEKVSLLSVGEEEVELEITIFAVDHFGSFIKGLSQDDFSLELPSGYSGRILSLESQTDEELGPYSATMLFDQSGSIQSTDPTHDRVAAGTKFVDLLSNGDEAAVVAFASGGNFISPFEILNDFSRDKESLKQTIAALAGQENGGTPLYKSIHDLIPYTSNNSSNGNKALIAFTDGEDTDGGVSIDQIVDQACSNEVKVFTVGLSSGIDAGELSEVAFRTGGAVMLADDALQLVSLYSSLGDLLRGEAEFYKIKLAVRNQFSNWRPGSRLSGYINLNLSEEYPVQLPFQFRLTRENAGIFSQREPECDCEKINSSSLLQKYKDEANQMRNSLANPFPQNQGITCAYIDLYNAKPDKFKWAGLAGIVSGIVGNEIENNKDYQSFGLSFEFFNSVVNGNAAVFEDIAWQHLAYEKGGIEEIARIYCAEQSKPAPAISLEVYQAWLKIDQADSDLVWEGNRDLLYHEQKNILQDSLYSPHPIMWTITENVYGDKLVSPVPNHDSKFDTDNYEIDNFSDRWQWIEKDILPAWKAIESNSSNKNILQAEFSKYCHP